MKSGACFTNKVQGSAKLGNVPAATLHLGAMSAQTLLMKDETRRLVRCDKLWFKVNTKLGRYLYTEVAFKEI